MSSAKIADGKPVELSIKRWLKDKHVPLPCVVNLNGSLAAADVCAAPDAPPIAIKGSIYLVTAQTTIEQNSTLTMGVLSWIDNGFPRLLAGRLTNLVADQVHAHLLKDGAAATPQTVPPMPLGEHGVNTIDEDVDDDPIGQTATSLPKMSPLRKTEGLDSAAHPKSTQESNWSGAVAASKEISEKGLSDPGEALHRGDIILHPRFGKCKVARDPMFGKLKVRRPTGALLDLHLKVLNFERMPDEDGARVFAITIGNR